MQAPPPERARAASTSPQVLPCAEPFCLLSRPTPYRPPPNQAHCRLEHPDGRAHPAHSSVLVAKASPCSLSPKNQKRFVEVLRMASSAWNCRLTILIPRWYPYSGIQLMKAASNLDDSSRSLHRRRPLRRAWGIQYECALLGLVFRIVGT